MGDVTVVLCFRVLMIILCTETALRYVAWWVEVGRYIGDNEDGDRLRPLMLGVAIVQAAAAALTVYAVILGAPLYDRPGASLIVISVDCAFMVGTMFHLAPCWRITCGMSAWRSARQFLYRAAAAVLITGIWLAS